MKERVPHPTDKHVGMRVRARRMMMGLSQEKLADGIGLTFQQIQKYEKGTNRISASKLQVFASILHVPVGFFFEGGPNASGLTKVTASTPDYVSKFLGMPDGLELVKAFTQIKNAKLRRCIVNLVEEIVESGQK